MSRTSTPDAPTSGMAARIDRGRVLQPPGQVVGDVQENAGDVTATPDAVQRRADVGVRPRNAGDGVARGAAQTRDRRPALSRVPPGKASRLFAAGAFHLVTGR